jgi:8-oxo-dGTP pyrophosphatase MutT (NUDIX family)
MIDKALFVLCYLQRDDQLLMIHRNKAPNKGKWNCVGGHIEPGETPYAACLREVLEETGYRIPEPAFNGLLTWEGFEIPLGGLYMFSSEAPSGQDAVTSADLRGCGGQSASRHPSCIGGRAGAVPSFCLPGWAYGRLEDQ